jgi:hypothetical protein
MITSLPPIDQCSPGMDWGGFIINGQIVLPWKLLVEKYGIVWFCCQGSLQDPPGGFDSLANIAEARHFVDIVGTYYWSNPLIRLQAEIDRFSRSIDQEKPDFIWLDVEQHQGEDGGELDPVKIAEHAQGLFDALHTRFPQIRATIYTRVDFIQFFAPRLMPLMATLDHISMAAWPDFGLDAYHQPLADIRNGIMEECTDFNARPPRPHRTINIFDGRHGPDLGLNPKAKIFNWQHSSRLRPEEVRGDHLLDHGYDWNRMNLTKEQMLRWVKFQPLEEVAPPTETHTVSTRTSVSRSNLTLASLDARLKVVEEKLKKLEESGKVG